MKSMKLVFTSILMLAVMLFISIPNVYADSNEEDILEVIKNNDFIDIKKIEFDKQNKVIPSSIEDVNINSKNMNLQDGDYLLRRGTGWVLGGDRSFIKSGFAGPNETLRILEGKTVSYEHSVMVGAGVEVDFNFVKAAVEVTYEHSIKTSESISTGYEIDSKDKNVYAKTYATFNRYDLVKVRNGKVTGHATTYEPEGSWLKYVRYNNGEHINQEDLKEKVDRCILGQQEEVDIKNSISVYGTSITKSMDILLDSSSNTIHLTNRTKNPIHLETGSDEYFKIELLDSNNKVKASMSMAGNDYSADSKYDVFDNIEYSIGDKINIYHKEYENLLKVKGPISGSNDIKSEFVSYVIKENGLEFAKVKNSISVYGTSIVKNMDILLVDDIKRIKLVNRSNTPIHQETGSGEYFKIEILDSNNRLKASMSMAGNDYSANKKYDSFDNIEYSIGDKIKIYHKEAENLLKVNGVVNGEYDPNTSIREYIIRENNLDINFAIIQGVKNIKPINNTSLAIESRSWSPNIVLGNLQSGGSSVQWEFIYNSEKNAYTIRNLYKKQYLSYATSTNYTTLRDHANVDYAFWKINKVGNEYYITNYVSGLALDVENGNVSFTTPIVVSEYTGKNSQKFRIE